ncbi:DMT family transporter [Staphylospora marina]|uniref:DMT family transporter n=1 Tax=Staphylospora marina TaxID=2490858 RepID=UPI000F5BD998|nr:DMT family transporter [Staphylospora marina]
MSPKNLGILLLLSAIWGSSFIFIRISAPEFGPVGLVELRLGIALIALLIYALLLKHRLTVFRRWKQLLLLGAVNAAIPFVLISCAELTIPASTAAILNATTPLFTAILARFWLDEPLTRAKIIGLVLGFAGVGVLVGWAPLEYGLPLVLAVLFMLLAAFLYAVGSIYAKKAFQGSALELSIGQLAGATVFLLPWSIAFLPEHSPSMKGTFSMLALSLLCTAFAYLLYFHLVKEAGPTQTTYVTFLAPAFGVIWGMLLLNETVTAGTVTGLLMIFASVFMLTGRLPKRKASQSPSSDERT